MAFDTLPYLEGIDGDVSYPRRFDRANEYFFQTKETEQYPWEAVGYDDGTLFYEYSTMPLRYRKMFCWGGTHKGGTKWQDYLTHDDDDKYVEIQAGIFPTQLHGGSIEANSEIGFMQVFGMFGGLDPPKKFGDDLETSKTFVHNHIFNNLTDERLKGQKKMLEVCATQPITKRLHKGKGWGGALELLRLKYEGSPISIDTMAFEEDTFTDEQAYWLSLLDSSIYPPLPANLADGLKTTTQSYMIDETWLPYLHEAVKHESSMSESHRFHIALTLSEAGNNQEALKLLKDNEDESNSSMYYRTIGAIHLKLEESNKALAYYHKAYDCLNLTKIKHYEADFLAEYLELLFELEDYTQIWELYLERLDSNLIINEEMLIPIAKTAFELQKFDTLDTLLTDFKPERIREANNVLVELWYKRKAYDLGNIELDEVRKLYTPPPDNIDFRMV